MADATMPGLLLTGDHASRPAATAVGSGALYACSTHGLVYQSDSATWSTWATLGEAGTAAHLADTVDAHDASAISFTPNGSIAATDVQAAIQEVRDEASGTETLPVSIIDAKGDLIAGTAADTASRLAVGVNDQVLRAASGQSAGVEWAYGLPRYVILGSNSAVSSTAFADAGIAFPLVASAFYFVEYFLHLDTNATTVGIKLALNSGDAGTTIWLGQFNPTTAPALNTQYAGGITFTKDTQPFVTTAGPGGTRSLATLFGLVQTTTNPDTLQLRHGSETATLTTIYANSVGRCTRIA